MSITKLQGYAALIIHVAVVIETVRLLRNMGVYDAGATSNREAGSGDGG